MNERFEHREEVITPLLAARWCDANDKAIPVIPGSATTQNAEGVRLHYTNNHYYVLETSELTRA